MPPNRCFVFALLLAFGLALRVSAYEDELLSHIDEEDELDPDELSIYHRKLLAIPAKEEMPEFKAPWDTSTLEKRRMWPTWWNEEKEKKLQEEILIGTVTTGRFHPRLAFQRATWWSDERINMTEVYSDVDHDPDVPNLIYSHCDSSYNFGLWCKNKHMLRMWQTPRYKKYKWFIRANDDSYYHLENIYDYLTAFDHTESIVIGEMFCSNPSGVYPSGGPGIILSRGFVDNVNWEAWDLPIQRETKIKDYFEDVLWGRYMNDSKNTRFIQHNGISQSAIVPGTGHMNLFMDFRGKPWPFPFRPLAYHQTGKWQQMVALHRKLHSIDYYPPAPVTFTFPPCKCKPDFHSRCMWDLTKKGNRMPCRWDGLQSQCLGPGDYTYKGYEELLNATKNANDKTA